MQSISPTGSWWYQSATALRRLVHLVFALGCLGGFVLLAPAEAAAACTTSNVNHGNTNGGKTYRINAVSLDLLTTIGDREAAASAVHLSASTWNNHANAGYFRIGLSTSDTSLPSTKAACDAAGINYSLVVVKNQTVRRRSPRALVRTPAWRRSS